MGAGSVPAGGVNSADAIKRFAQRLRRRTNVSRLFRYLILSSYHKNKNKALA